MSLPKSRSYHWWQRGVSDGKACAHARRWRYFEVYRDKAAEVFAPGEMLGVFGCVYRTAFRAGYDAEKAARELRNTFSPRPKRRGNLKQS